jgi:hypothetical protein
VYRHPSSADKDEERIKHVTMQAFLHGNTAKLDGPTAWFNLSILCDEAIDQWRLIDAVFLGRCYEPDVEAGALHLCF